MTATQTATAKTTRPATAAARTPTNPNHPPACWTQAETLRESLSQALSDTRDLITSIKRNQKQNRLVETTLRSLKQLEHIGA
jgi:hypothetical protein